MSPTFPFVLHSVKCLTKESITKRAEVHYIPCECLELPIYIFIKFVLRARCADPGYRNSNDRKRTRL
ncbi:hypothetical protein PNOK_0661800 [Pyrrhoderma noxium]|uniref:Uncharacterized protein n=1 Tax=Pyrrhoderma noxium TaxID=2282107 RepID=A0A286UET2_9AGAM|nr:hypothetical protein PNOK_0661800 [Pyrrhoderma noxium]